MWQAVVLACIQGITEFVPISSSGHLVVVRSIFGWSDQGGLLFDTVLHAGSFCAIVVYFWREWIAIVRSYFGPRENSTSFYRRLPWLVLVATLPIIAVGPFLQPFLENRFALRNATVVGLSMLMTAALFFLSDLKYKPAGRPLGFLNAAWIGCMQIISLLPGASRSGWTTSAGMLCGQTRETAVRFSFYMALPAIAGAVVIEFKDFVGTGELTCDPLQVWLGFLVSFMVSLGAIRFCLMYLRSHRLRLFGVYLAIVGLLLVIFVR